MKLNQNTTIRELYAEPLFAGMRGNWVSSVGDQWAAQRMDCSLRALHEQQPTWDAEDMLVGLRRVERAARDGAPLVFPVYTEEEREASPDKAQAQLIFLPAPEEKRAGFALLLSGGGYGAVCHLAEAIPAAAQLNELGISCFCLSYRTAAAESFVSGLLPKPLEDVAAALRLIRREHARFGVDPGCYLLGGFSAGGYLAALWGTAHLGARSYGLPQPELLMLAYPLTNTAYLPDNPLSAYLKTGLYGAGWTAGQEERYATDRHIDTAYPPVYLAAAGDDDTIPPADTAAFEAALRAAGRPCVFELGAHGGHGFGLGSRTALRGWIGRAAAFWEEQHGER